MITPLSAVDQTVQSGVVVLKFYESRYGYRSNRYGYRSNNTNIVLVSREAGFITRRTSP